MHVLPQKPPQVEESPVKLIFEKNKKNGKHFLKVLDISTGQKSSIPTSGVIEYSAASKGKDPQLNADIVVRAFQPFNDVKHEDIEEAQHY